MPQTVHTYRPLLSCVGGGEANLRDAERTQRSVTPRGCTWIQDSAIAVDPASATVECASGRRVRYRYDDLIIGVGLVPDTDSLQSIDAALHSPAVASIYLDHAEKTWRLIEALPPRGHAVFTVPRAPVSCTGTTIKPLFLAAAYWQRPGHRPDITLVIDRQRFLGVPAIDDRLSTKLQDLGVRVLHSTRVAALEPEAQSITVANGDTSEQLSYNLLHLVPPFRGPHWLQTSGLTGGNPHGLVDVDPKTLRHNSYDDIWSAG